MVKRSSRQREGESGQVLILFVVMFTIIMAIAAFAIDQGFWFGRRRIAQSAVDAASRGGAIAYLGPNTSDCDKANGTAGQNGVDSAALSCQGGVDRDSVDGQCLSVGLERQTSSLFGRFFGLDSINIGADAVACAGTVDEIRVNADDDGPEGIAVVLGPDGDRDCFTGNGTNTTLRLGFECVIWGSLADSPGQEHNRLLWTDEEGCAGDIAGTVDEIRDGDSWTCHESTGAENIEVETLEISDVESGDAANGVPEQEDILFAFRSRLQQPTDDCYAPEQPAPGDAASFENAFGWADGAGGAARPPPPFPNSTAARTGKYVLDDCWDNPRLVVMPITTDGGTSGSNNKDVDGFAFVYLTGCYNRETQPIIEPNPDAELNVCANSSDVSLDPSGDDNSSECTSAPSNFCRVEVRGVPLWLFLPEGAIGDIGDMDDTDGVNFPLTIQTME